MKKYYNLLATPEVCPLLMYMGRSGGKCRMVAGFLSPYFPPTIMLAVVINKKYSYQTDNQLNHAPYLQLCMHTIHEYSPLRT